MSTVNDGQMTPVGPCPAAHREDPSGCDGPADAVLLIDAHGGRVTGCVNHIAAMLAALAGARVYAGSVPGAAIEAYQHAQTVVPFAWRQTSAAGRGQVVA